MLRINAAPARWGQISAAAANKKDERGIYNEEIT